MTIFASAVLGPDGRPLDQIRLTGVTATGHHGVLSHERAEGQEFGADVVLHLDTRPAATGDALADTVSYADVAEQVHAVLAGSPADLVETVAERIAAAVLEHEAVVAVDVRVHKPQAPIAVPFDDVEVAIRRDRVKTPVVAARQVEPVEAAGPVDAAGPVAAAAPPPFAVGAALPVPFPPVPPVPAPVPIPAPVPVPAHPEAAAQPDPVVDRLEADPVEPVEVVLAIGANLGDAQATLREAVTDLDRLPGIQVTEVSPLARTTAVGGPEDQPDYLNAVLIARTTLSPRALLRATQAVETAHGRVREEHWGPRTLDVDIVRYGSLVARADDLEVPHPRAHERAFVLVPWAEVQPDAELPGLGGGPVARLAETAPDRAGIRWMALDWLTESSVRTGSYPVTDVPAHPAPPAADAAADEPGEPAQAGADEPAPSNEAEPPYQAAPAVHDAGHVPEAEAPYQAPPQAYDAPPAYAPPQQATPAYEPERPAEPAPATPYPPVARPPLQESGAVPVSPFPRVLPADPVDAPAPTPLPVRPTTPATPFPPVPPAAPPADSGRVHTPVSPFAPVRPPAPYPATPPAGGEPPVAPFPLVAHAPVPPAPAAPAQPPLWQPVTASQPEAPEPDAANDRWIPFDHPDQER